MYNNFYVLDRVQEMHSHVLCQNVGNRKFEYRHKQVYVDYESVIKIHTIIDTGIIIPIITYYHKVSENKPSVLSMTNTSFFSINGSTGECITLHYDDGDFNTKLKIHGYDDHEIEIIQSIKFSMNIFISKQK